MANAHKYKEEFMKKRKELASTINFAQMMIENYRKKLESNFHLRFPMLLLYEALQAGRAFLSITAEDSIDYASGGVNMLRNGFESIVWGVGCLHDIDGPDLIAYIWEHQDLITERHLEVYKNWNLPVPEGTNHVLKEIRSKLNKKPGAKDNKYYKLDKPMRSSFSPRYVKNEIFLTLVNKNGWFRYFYEVQYKQSIATWHSSAFALSLEQYEDVKLYFLTVMVDGFISCLKVFVYDSLRKLCGSESLPGKLYRQLGESLRQQMIDINSGKKIQLKPSVQVKVQLREKDWVKKTTERFLKQGRPASR